MVCPCFSRFFSSAPVPYVTSVDSGAHAGTVSSILVKPLATKEELEKITDSLLTSMNSPMFQSNLTETVAELNAMLQADPRLFPHLNPTLRKEGLNPTTILTQVSVAWNDISRYKGSSSGDRITDLHMALVACEESRFKDLAIFIKPANFFDIHPSIIASEDTPLIRLIDSAARLVTQQAINKAFTVENLKIAEDGTAARPLKVRFQTVVTPAIPGALTEVNPKVMTYSSPSLFMFVTPEGKVFVKYVPPHTETTLFAKSEDGKECNHAINPREDDRTFAPVTDRTSITNTVTEASLKKNPFDDCFYLVEIPLRDPKSSSSSIEDDDFDSFHFVAHDESRTDDCFGRELMSYVIESKGDDGYDGTDLMSYVVEPPVRAAHFSHAVKADLVTGAKREGEYDVGYPSRDVVRDPTKQCSVTIINNVAVSCSEQAASREVLRDCLLKQLTLLAAEDVANIVASPAGVIFVTDSIG